MFYNETGGSPDYSVSYENDQYKLVEPLMFIGHMFERYYPGYIDWEGIGVFAGYMIGVFFIAEFLRVLNIKFWEKLNSRENLEKES